jgi:hypothetical protein
MLVIATGGSVYSRPEYRHLVEAARAHREGWGKGRAEVVKTFDASLGRATAESLAAEAGEPQPRYALTPFFRVPGRLDRTLLRPPIAVSSHPA